MGLGSGRKAAPFLDLYPFSSDEDLKNYHFILVYSYLIFDYSSIINKIKRTRILTKLDQYLDYSPIVAILGPRQCGKTTLSREVNYDHYFDLENPRDQARLENAQLVLEQLTGLVVIDEIQLRPEIFSLLRVLSDQQESTTYLILGSASRDLMRQGNQTLAGRIVFLYLNGFNLDEIDLQNWSQLWWRGGFPRAYLAPDETLSRKWIEDYISTFLERDIPQFGIQIPAATIRRFWIMLSHYHGQVINYSELGRSLQISDNTIRNYLDILESTFMVRVLRPWFTNTSKRLVKSPKIYLRDSGIFHSLQSISTKETLQSHPKLGASWEGFALEQIIRISNKPDSSFYYWRTQAGAEIDLFWEQDGKRYGVEFKYSDAPRTTRSMTIAMQDLELEHLWIVYPGKDYYTLSEKASVLGITDISTIWNPH